MYTADEATKQRQEAYIAALQHERDGYVARRDAKAKGLHTSGLDLTVEQLDDRISQVDAVIAYASAEKRPRKD